MLIITSLSFLLLTLLLIYSSYLIYNSRVKEDLKSNTYILAEFLSISASGDEVSYLEQIDKTKIQERITLIDPSGKVVFDTEKDPLQLENHIDRPEIIDAKKNGFGESVRFSVTLGTYTHYFSLLLSSGDVLRISQTSDNVYRIVFERLPYVLSLYLIILVFMYYLSGKLTKRTLKPLNNFEFGKTDITEIYDELSPFIKRINHQKVEIEKQVAMLKERSDTISSIMENMKEGLILLTLDSKIISANKSVLNIFSSKEDLTGKNVIELTRNPKILEAIKNACEGNPHDIILEINGAFYSIFFNPVSDIGIMVLLHDITEKILAESKRKEFSANVSHEVKTPLTTIMGYAEMLSCGMAKKQDTIEFYNKIKNEAGRLLNLIEDIILLSELDEDSITKTFEKFDLKELLLEVCQGLALKAEKNNISLNIKGDGQFINANRTFIYNMTSNLIDNAIKYNKQGGFVNVETCENDGNILLIIEDNGIGIPKNQQDRIFERFYTVDKSRSKKRGGTGLGLSIVKHIAQYHNASIELTSELNCGTIIKITFPRIS